MSPQRGRRTVGVVVDVQPELALPLLLGRVDGETLRLDLGERNRAVVGVRAGVVRGPDGGPFEIPVSIGIGAKAALAAARRGQLAGRPGLEVGRVDRSILAPGPEVAILPAELKAVDIDHRRQTHSKPSSSRVMISHVRVLLVPEDQLFEEVDRPHRRDPLATRGELSRTPRIVRPS
jgi:hypothetical protein